MIRGWTARVPRGVGAAGGGRGAPAWTRRDTFGRVAPTYGENPSAAPTVLSGLEGDMADSAKVRARMIVAASIDLYREMALSALSLFRL